VKQENRKSVNEGKEMEKVWGNGTKPHDKERKTEKQPLGPSDALANRGQLKSTRKSEEKKRKKEIHPGVKALWGVCG